jgi:hypothetical protein
LITNDQCSKPYLSVFILFSRSFFGFIYSVITFWVKSRTLFYVLKLWPSVGDLGKGYDNGD